jgi:phage nucleotide-binding protein
MAIKIQSTDDISSDGIKVIVYGKAGIGKTRLMATAPSPIILSCESGLLSLRKMNIPFIEIKTVEDIEESLEFVQSEEGKKYKTICLDSITEISEVVLSNFKPNFRDPRKAYGEMNDKCASLIRSFRDIKGKNIVFSAQRGRFVDEDSGITNYFPAMPGRTLLQLIPYQFDGVFYMTLMQDAGGKDHRILKTAPEIGFEAKDRSGALRAVEKPDLTYLFNKITGDK